VPALHPELTRREHEVKYSTTCSLGAALTAMVMAVLAPACGDDAPPPAGSAASAGTGGGANDAAAGTGGTAPDSGVDSGADSAPDYSSCSKDGWCWALPEPQGNDLLAAWANSPTDVWVAGVHGTVLHHDGQRWSNALVPTTVTLRGVWASAPNDIWLVGDDGVVLRFDGQTWKQPALSLGSDGGALTTDLTAVYGTATNDVWITGAGGTLVHWDGASFSNPTSGTTRKLNAVWAASATEVWAVGEAGTVLHYDGVEWAAQVSGAGSALNSVHGTGPSDVWAVGVGILHYDGKRWSDARAGTTTTTLWEVVAEGTDSVWLFGDGGGVWHRETTSWQKRPSGTQSSLLGVARLDTGKLLSAGQTGTLLYWDGAGRALLTRGSTKNHLAIGGSSATNIWAVGDEIVRFDGLQWSEVKLESRPLFGLTVPGPNETWAVGSGGTILRWSDAVPLGAAVPSGTSAWLRSLWLDAEGHGWIVGAAGALFEVADGALTKKVSGTTQDLVDIWAASATAAWAVGEGGVVAQYDGTAWRTFKPAGSTAALRGIWGSAANDVWIVGAEATILHFDGSTWSAVAPGDGGVYSLNDIWGSAANDVYAVGSGGTILHFDGSSWSAQESGTGTTLNGVWGARRDDIWVVGESGAILRRLR